MDQQLFLKRLEEEHLKCVEISRAKNADYATAADAFKNFRGCSVLGIDPADGILVRMSDKMARASNLLKRDAAVKGESVADTLRDLSNYALILLLLIEHETAKVEESYAPKFDFRKRSQVEDNFPIVLPKVGSFDR